MNSVPSVVNFLRLSASDYRPFGNTGLRVPPIVFGTSALGNLYCAIPDVAKLEIVSAWFDHVSPPVFIITYVTNARAATDRTVVTQ